MGQKQPQIQPDQGRKHRDAQRQCEASPHPRQQQPQQQAGDGNLRQVKAQSVIRLHWALPIQKAGDEVGVCLHARIGAPHRRSAQILQPRRRGAHQHHLVPQLRGRELAPQHVGCRDITERAAPLSPGPSVGHQHCQPIVGGDELAAPILVQFDALNGSPFLRAARRKAGPHLRQAQQGTKHGQRQGFVVLPLVLRQQWQ